MEQAAPRRKGKTQDLQDVEEISLNKKRKDENEERVDDASSVLKRPKEANEKEEEERMTNNQHLEVEDKKCAAIKKSDDAAVATESPATSQSKNDWEKSKKEPPKGIEDQVYGLRSNTLESFSQHHLTDDQAKAFGLALAGNTSLKKLMLYDKSTTLSAVKDLCDGILQSQVENIHLGGIMSTNSAVRRCVFQTIQSLPSLTTLSVQASLDIKAVNCLGEVLKNNTSIREFTFDATRFHRRRANAISKALTQSHIQKLSINCHDNGLNPLDTSNNNDNSIVTIFEAIQQLMVQSLLSLNICFESDVTPVRNIFSCLANCLKHSTTLKELVVCKGYLDVDSMMVFSQGLRQNLSLTTLSFRNSSINDDSAVVLAEHLNQDLLLETLELVTDNKHPWKDIGPRGALALVRTVAHIPTMQKLVIQSSLQIGYKGLRLIGAELSHLRLRELHLTFASGVDNSYLNNQKVMESRNETKQAWLQGIRENKHLWKLNICNVGCDGDFLDELKYHLDFNCWGRRLLTINHGLSSTIWCYVLARAGSKKFSKHVYSFVYYVLREHPDLIQASW